MIRPKKQNNKNKKIKENNQEKEANKKANIIDIHFVF